MSQLPAKNLFNSSCYHVRWQTWLIIRNSAWKKVQTPTLVKKSPKNVPKLNLNILPQVDILWFSLETLSVLHLIQLWLAKYQLTYMSLGTRGA